MNILHAGFAGYLALILILLISLAVSYLFYRKYNISDFKKAALALLRTASLFFIAALLLNPFFTAPRDTSKKAADVILVDNSLSLNIGNRFEELKPALDKVTKLSSGTKVFAFGSGLLGEIKDNDKIFTGSEYRTYSTNLAASLEELYSMPKDFTVNSVTVISDGIIKESGSLIPAATKLGVPFYYYLIGDTAQKNDVVLYKLFYNREAFTGSSSSVKAIINSYGYSGTLNVNLYEEGILKQTKNVLVNTGENEYSAEFKVTSGFPGPRKYSVRIDTLKNEITTLNNSRDFFIKYAENKFRVLVVAGSPGDDFSAFRQSLGGLENFTADYFTGKSPDSFYEGALPSFDGYSALFLYGFPLAITDRNLTGKISNEVTEKKIPVVFFNASNTGYENLKSFENILPFTVNGTQSSSYASASKMLPFDAPEEPEPIRKIGMLPPAYFSKGIFSPRPGADVLGVTVTENEPAILLYSGGEIRSAAFLGCGIYKWALNNSAETDNVIKNLSAVLFNLVLDGNSRNKFRLNADKDCYAFSEPVEISAFAGGIAPENLSVRLKISGKDFSKEYEMEKNGVSSFRTIFTPDSVSDYIADGKLFNGAQLTAGDAIRFSCGRTADEYIITRSDDRLLKSLAANTGGADIRGYGKSAFEKKNVTEIQEPVLGKSLFRDSVYILVFIILLLSLEWFLRKRFSMP